MQVSFGSGLLSFTPAGANPTPVLCGVLQDVTIKTAGTTKKLYGQLEYPVAVAKGEGNISGTAKFAQFSGSLIKQAIAGATITTGQTLGAIGEPGTVGTTPYQVTVTNSATWVADLGVYDLTAQKPMTRVASSPTTGQYSAAAGVYTFAAADTTHVMSFNYSYTGTGGQTVSFTNQIMGAANTFSASFFNTYNGLGSGVKIWACVIPGLDFAMKNSDFTMLDLTFDAAADSLGRVIDFYTAE